MKIAIVGASGLVGSSLLKGMQTIRGDGWQIIGTYNKHPFPQGVPLNVTNSKELKDFMDFYRPTVLVWLAGSKDLGLLEKNPELSFLLNERPLAMLADLLKGGKFAVKIIYVSSDYVFDGNKGAYAAADAIAPVTVYGRSKIAAEAELAALGRDCVCLRTSAIMSVRGGFLGWLLERLERGGVGLYTNTIFSPTPAVAFNRAIVKIIEESLWGEVLHFAGEAISRYDFGRKVAALLGVAAERVIPELADTGHSTFQANLSLCTSDELRAFAPTEADLLWELKQKKEFC